ncbi:DUF6894 family protein [Bradyrhizobium zhanjiangense]|uniref:DUF6894 domain-containing protein n=1 Tax=Bradyrhizobium zhanjiangense TaxID=1325107 RepID=A0A4Q0QEW0_9BRAD|nr:hypothetical protein [Bradyrhizobium zhanjiangense]RXG89251.1 hypothetical protein EAS61_28225 [Bradyrhizobium zhanjiangense]
MRKLFFDHTDSSGVIIDDVGVDLPSLVEARHEACLSLGEEAKLFNGLSQPGRVAVVVRDEGGPILEVGATFDAKPLP